MGGRECVDELQTTFPEVVTLSNGFKFEVLGLTEDLGEMELTK